MSITIEQLDGDGKENNITILIGKNLLLKFTPGDSIFFSEKILQDLIKTPDLLCSDLLTMVMEEKKLRLIDKIPMSELRPEFLNQMEVLVNLVNNYTISYINIIITNYIIININLHFDLDFFRCKAKISTRIIHKRTNVH